MTAEVPMFGIGLALGLQLLAAGITHIANPELAARAVGGAVRLPAPIARLATVVLALVELAAAVAIASPWLRSQAAVPVLLLLLVYTAAVLGMLLSGRGGQDCGCGGLVAGIPVGRGLLARNLMLCAFALACVLVTAPAPSSPWSWLAGLAIGVTGWGVFLLIDHALARGRMLADD